MLNVLNYFHWFIFTVLKSNVATTTLEVIHMACVCIVFSLDSIALGWCVFRVTVSNHPKNPCFDISSWKGRAWCGNLGRDQMVSDSPCDFLWSMILCQNIFPDLLGAAKDWGNIQIPESESFLLHIKVRWVGGRDGGTPQDWDVFYNRDRQAKRARKEGEKQTPGQKESQSANESKWIISTFTYSFMEQILLIVLNVIYSPVTVPSSKWWSRIKISVLLEFTF